jgi:hypothetical protein
MLNGIIDSRQVRTQKAALYQSSGSSFIPCCLEDRLENETLKESLRQWDKEMRRWDEAMRQHDEYYAQAFTQQHAMLQVSSLNYFIHYRTLSNTFKTNL